MAKNGTKEFGIAYKWYAKAISEEYTRSTHKLSEREELYYKLHYVDGITNRSLADTYGIGDVRVGQICRKALRKIDDFVLSINCLYDKLSKSEGFSNECRSTILIDGREYTANVIKFIMAAHKELECYTLGHKYGTIVFSFSDPK